MNKTVTINLSGIVFHIDDNAFEVLKKYIDNLKSHFANVQGKEEIISDIESRMAEMFSEKVGPSKDVIMIKDVQEVIDVMGRPEQVAGDEEKTAPENKNSDSGYYYEGMKKRFFRNPDDKVLGGVSSGIASYFDVDPLWIRLAFVIMVLAGFSGILIYIILWIIIPEANTAAEKLQMRGERVTVANIQKGVQSEFEELKKRGEDFAKSATSDDMQMRMKSTVHRTGGAVGDVFRVLFKIIAIFFGIIITIISIAVLVGLSIGIFSGIGALKFAIPPVVTHMVLSESQLWWLIIGSLLAVGIPFTLLLLNGLKILFKVNLNLKMIGAVMAGFWIIGIGICIITGIQIASDYAKDSSVKKIQQISMANSNTIIVKADNHWITNEDGDDYRHFSMGDLDDLVLLGDNKDSVIAPFVRFDVEQSENDSIYVILKTFACGNSYENAHRRAVEINYSYTVTDSVITLPNYFVMKTSQQYRGQNVKMILKVPVGKTVRLDKSLGWMPDDISNATDTWDHDMLGHDWKMTKDGLECLNCPADFDHRDDSEKNIHVEPGRITIDKHGKHIEITSNEIKVDTL